jgi:hypothetical protein
MRSAGQGVPVGFIDDGGVFDGALILVFAFGVWVPETVHAALDLLRRRQPATGMIRRWRYS